MQLLAILLVRSRAGRCAGVGSPLAGDHRSQATFLHDAEAQPGSAPPVASFLPPAGSPRIALDLAAGSGSMWSGRNQLVTLPTEPTEPFVVESRWKILLAGAVIVLAVPMLATVPAIGADPMPSKALSVVLPVTPTLVQDSIFCELNA